MNCNRLKDLS